MGRSFDLAIAPVLARHIREQLFIGPGRIGIGDDNIGRNDFTADEPHTIRAPALDRNFRNFRIETDFIALPRDQTG